MSSSGKTHADSWLPLLWTIWAFSLLATAQGIWFDLSSTATKCLSEELNNNVVVMADYLAFSDNASHTPTISVKVTSPYGNNLHHKENATTGQFAFTTHEAGNYLACFWVDNYQQVGGVVSVSLEWKTGIAAKDWESVARKEKIEGVELELRKLEGTVEAIHENLLYLKNREAEMRVVSETTNTRVAWFSIVSLGVCAIVSALQVWHLKLFFQKKKLI